MTRIPSAAQASSQHLCLFLILLLGVSSCGKKPTPAASPSAASDDVLFRVGSITVRKADLEHQLDVNHGGRRDEASRDLAMAFLERRARFTQAALDAGLAEDPLVRAETSRLLDARLREKVLAPRTREALKVSKEELLKIYQDRITDFQEPEKRRVAVLWLDSGTVPGKVERCVARLREAREFALKNRDFTEHPGKGFSLLGPDYSEHAASRYKGGDIGWIDHGRGMDSWTRAVSEIALGLLDTGSISEVVARPEGVFLVRLTDQRPGLSRSFEEVVPQLEKSERDRLSRQIEVDFEREIESAHPVVRQKD